MEIGSGAGEGASHPDVTSMGPGALPCQGVSAALLSTTGMTTSSEHITGIPGLNAVAM